MIWPMPHTRRIRLVWGVFRETKRHSGNTWSYGLPMSWFARTAVIIWILYPEGSATCRKCEEACQKCEEIPCFLGFTLLSYLGIEHKHENCPLVVTRYDRFLTGHCDNIESIDFACSDSPDVLSQWEIARKIWFRIKIITFPVGSCLLFDSYPVLLVLHNKNHPLLRVVL